jgi:hypothetical protein
MYMTIIEKSDAFYPAPMCPDLGMRDDPGTSFRYPTLANYCRHCRPCAIPLLEHQENYCIQAAYQDCPVFRQPAGRALPSHFKARVSSLNTPARRLVIVVLALLLLQFAGWKVLRSEAASPSEQLPAFASHIIPVSGSETRVPAATAPEGPAMTPGLPVGTPFQPDALQQAAFHSQAHVLEIPFQAGGYHFLMHRVHAGESLAVLEVTYVTTSEVIRALNDPLALPITADRVILIAPGLQVVDPGLPAFELYEVTDEGFGIGELARKLDADAALLKEYNDCAGACRFAAGDWVIVPRHR